MRRTLPVLALSFAAVALCASACSSTAAAPTATVTVTATPEQEAVAASPAATNPFDVSYAENFAKVTDREWAAITRDPAAHRGEGYVIYGKITQFDAATGPNGFYAWTTGQAVAPDSSGYYDYVDGINVGMIGWKGEFDAFKEDDVFRAEVTVGGADGSTPAVVASKIERLN